MSDVRLSPALTRRTSDNSNGAKQPSDADLAKKKNIRKAKGSIKVKTGLGPGFSVSNYRPVCDGPQMIVEQFVWSKSDGLK